ncbi:MAG: DUF3299 domain-containing protein [Pirellulaceae bacterium]
MTAMESPAFQSSGADVYRAVSRAAVAALVLGVVGLTAFTTPYLVPIPLIGLAFAVLAFRSFLRFPDELVGKPLMVVGTMLCLVGAVLAPAYHAYIYATEVPDGYVRVNFSTLMSDKNEADIPSEEAIALDGESIFIKGYVHPSSMDTMLAKRFVIVPDLGTCCFGGQPPLTNMVEVTLTGEQYAKKDLRKKRLAGTLRVDPHLKPVDGLNGVYYQLRADILK